MGEPRQAEHADEDDNGEIEVERSLLHGEISFLTGFDEGESPRQSEINTQPPYIASQTECSFLQLYPIHVLIQINGIGPAKLCMGAETSFSSMARQM
jgi:hypothetical protein